MMNAFCSWEKCENGVLSRFPPNQTTACLLNLGPKCPLSEERNVMKVTNVNLEL